MVDTTARNDLLASKYGNGPGGGGTSYISYVSLTVEVNISAFPPCDVAFNVAPATKSFSIAIPDILAGHEAIPVFWLHAIPVLLSHIVATKWWL